MVVLVHGRREVAVATAPCGVPAVFQAQQWVTYEAQCWWVLARLRLSLVEQVAPPTAEQMLAPFVLDWLRRPVAVSGF